MRLFLAVNLPVALRARIHADIEPMRRACPGVAWVHPEHLHFTLKFLGEVSNGASTALQKTVGVAVQVRKRFTIILRGMGAFPNFRRPRVVWIGVKDDRSLTTLARSVEEACVSLGFQPEVRPFGAHLTVGRVKRELNVLALQCLERAGFGMHNEYVLDVQSVDLMQSELRVGGPSYTMLASLPFQDIT
jgi:2'-5' RNA ligase